jgi:hypothetical protein
MLIALVVIVLSGLANSAEPASPRYCGEFNGSRVYLDWFTPEGTGDYSLAYTATYPKPSGKAQSSIIFMILDLQTGIYFEKNGFDCSQPNGRGTCSHFEFNPNSETLERQMADKATWDKINNKNIGGLIARCLARRHK